MGATEPAVSVAFPEASMPGPPPTPAYLRLLRGNPARRPIPAEVEPQGPEQLPQPPSFLSDDAKAEWHRLIAELVRLRLVTTIDTSLFAVYCESYAHWKVSVETLNRMGAKDPVTAGLLIKDRDGPRQNPLVRIVRNAAAHMVHCASQFGLGPIARARIASAGFDPPPSGGKFSGLLVE
jgi:P27 family predicted phage terminase small subunit